MAGSYATPTGSGNPLSSEALTSSYLNTDPQAGFYAYLRQLGLLGNDPTSRYGQSRFQNQYGQYQAVAADNPNEGFFDYLTRQKPDLGAEYREQSPDQRFDFSSRLLTPRARWVNA